MEQNKQNLSEAILRNQALLSESTPEGQQPLFFVQTYHPDSFSVMFRIKYESENRSYLRLSLKVDEATTPGEDNQLREFIIDKLIDLGHKVINR